MWTIGYGSTRCVDDKPVCATTPPIGEAAARLLLTRDLKRADAAVTASTHVPLTHEQRIALDDFVYNLGAGALAHSTLIAKLNRGDYAGAADEFDKWDRAAGKVVAGLLRRREAERQLFMKET